jgi:ketosteroid isomerase-like protein
MKKLNLKLNLNLILILLLSMPVALFAQSEEEAIKKVVQGAYIDGLQNLGDIQTIRDGFHPDFEMLVFRNGQMSKLPIGTWIERVEQRKANPATTPPNITGKFLDVEITGTVAVVKLELHRDGSRIFTDYISLYKFEDGWKLVSKVYYQH